MKYLVKNGTLLEQSENVRDLSLVFENGCEIMDQFPPQGKEWNGVAWVNTAQAQAVEDAATLKDVKEGVKKQVNLLCYTKIISGFNSEALEEGEPYWYQSEAVDQANLQGMMTYAMNLDDVATVDYRCKKVSTGEDSFRPHTKAQLLKVFTDGKTRLLSLLKRAKTLKDMIDNTPNPADVVNIDLNTGW